ncbi:TlpA disulfide reductase family protein [Ramlibacter sp.]|uniref:TlpA family protein disulfide reductase n=1 Tax=Ramlibacter sp. TaxID=1917967 RepID=UPI002CCEABE9|nr:TlpA disulfide reductase family protein [Ramlibacter sp.]HWI83717.1 TlpA disulfide reductase family protein [Ramlibacter sp.]
MSATLALGPLTFTYGLLLALAGAVLGSLAGKLAGRAGGVDIEPLLFRILVTGLVAARAAFVVQFFDGYRQQPLGLLDIRDGGWSPLAGLLAASAYALFAALRRPPWRQPLAAAIGTAGAVWLLGALSWSMMPKDGDRLPPLAVQSIEGPVVPLASFRGKPTVVNLWATWCPPCRREMPVLQQAQAKRPDVNFVFLNQGEAPDRVRAFLAAEQLPLRNVLLDLHGQAGVELGHRALPTTLFYDAAGRLVDTRVGELSHATLSQRLGTLSIQPESR